MDAMTTDLLIRIGIFTLVLLVVWVAMRFLLKVDRKVFLWGLGSIAALAAILFLMRMISR